MRPQRGGVRPVSPGQTPMVVDHPRSPAKNYKSRLHCTLQTALCPARRTTSAQITVSTPSHRRWTRHPRPTASDIAAYLLFTILTAGVVLALCLVLTIVWPK